ncbi:MAG: hypothetical protein VW146_06050 [Gammaproteobacteria bacterium]
MKLIVRNTHKYLSFFISLQLLLWTVSGIYFAFNKIENVRGEQYILNQPSEILLGELSFNIPDAIDINIKKRLGDTIVIASTINGVRYFDAQGNPATHLTPEDAMAIVQQATSLEPQRVEQVNESTRGSEYRGRALPIYRVIAKNTNNAEINLYVNIYSGDISAIRSTQWRIWDLMWGFHIMDWVDRDNIDNILMKVFSILALISSITGLLLFFKVDIKKNTQ